MKPDDEGFLYPFVDQLLCIKCGLCKTVCPINNKIDLSKSANVNGQDFPFAHAVKHKDSGVRMCSSSGGAYTAITDYVMMENSSIWYGAAFDTDFIIRYIAATTVAERDQFRGSEYVQSNFELTFNEIKKNLIDRKTVLFTGTPCQTAGFEPPPLYWTPS